MLSVPSGKVPLIVAIRVAKAENLKPVMKDNKKKLNTKFRVNIQGGKKVKYSELVEDSSGNPEWGFSYLLKRHKGSQEPISLRVEDSDGHELGQVVIPLVKIGPKPYTHSPDQNPATSNNLICSELEPTKKNPRPSGFLIYWIWVEEYCPESDNVSRNSYKSMTSLFSSKKTLGSSKSRISVPATSSGNISSEITLNKPEKHKKASSFFHIKSKKDKAKKSTPDANIDPDSGSDVDSYLEPGNPFEVDVTRGIPVKTGDYSLSRGSDFRVDNGFDQRLSAPGHNVGHDQLDAISGSSNGSIFEMDSFSKHGNAPDYQPVVRSITPVTLPPVDSYKFNPRSPLSSKEDSPTMPRTLLGKSILASKQSPTLNKTDSQFSTDMEKAPQNQFGHKSNNESDYSLFGDHSVAEKPIATVKDSEYKFGLTSMTPVTLPPYITDSFKKPLPKINDSVQSKKKSDRSPPSSYQLDIITELPYNPFEQRNQPSNQTIVTNEHLIVADQDPKPKKDQGLNYSVKNMTPVTLPPGDSVDLVKKSLQTNIETKNDNPFDESSHKLVTSNDHLFSDGKDHSRPSERSSKNSELKSSVTSMTPITLPPVEADIFYKPMPTINEPSKSQIIDKSNQPGQRSPAVHPRKTYQPEIITELPYNPFEQRNQPSNQSVTGSEYSMLGDHDHRLQSSELKKATEWQSGLNSMSPVTLPPAEPDTSRSRSPANFKEPTKVVPLSVRNKPNQSVTASSPETPRRYQPIANEELDLLRNENSELRCLNIKAARIITELESELDTVKDCLFKLRSRLLEEGDTKYLEKL